MKNYNWYIIRNTSRTTSDMTMLKKIRGMVANSDLRDSIDEVRIAAEDIRTTVKGKERIVTKNRLPRYIFVKAVYSEKLRRNLEEVINDISFLEVNGKVNPVPDSQVPSWDSVPDAA